MAPGLVGLPKGQPALGIVGERWHDPHCELPALPGHQFGTHLPQCQRPQRSRQWCRCQPGPRPWATDSIGGPAPSSAAGELAGGEERRVCAIPAPAPVPATAKPKRWSITNANTRRQGLISYSNDQW
jgi:hypothetical protein